MSITSNVKETASKLFPTHTYTTNVNVLNLRKGDVIAEHASPVKKIKFVEDKYAYRSSRARTPKFYVQEMILTFEDETTENLNLHAFQPKVKIRRTRLSKTAKQHLFYVYLGFVIVFFTVMSIAIHK